LETPNFWGGGRGKKKTEKWVEFGFVGEFLVVFFFYHTILQKNMLMSKLDQAFFFPGFREKIGKRLI